MFSRKSRRSAWATVLMLLVATAGHADAQAVGGQDTPAAALSRLQASHRLDSNTFVPQAELDLLVPESGGGACASAAGIDLLQSLRNMAGFEKLANPEKAVLSSFSNQPELLKGRVTNEQFVRLVEFYRGYLASANLTIEVESAPNSVHARDGRTWSQSTGPDLAVMQRQMKVLSFTETRENGEVLGRHFVLLKDRTEGGIVVLDPGSPVNDRRYNLEFVPGPKGACDRVFLHNPPEFSQHGLIFELNTIFKVSLAPGDGLAGHRPVDAASLEYVKLRFDQTARELRQTTDFLNPRAWRRLTAGFGLPGLDLPVELGGSGWPAVKMIEVFRHAGRHNLNFRDIVGGAHARALLKTTDPDVRDVVRQFARGEGYMAIAITEPNAGSDVPSIKSSARKVDGGYMLSGTKRFNARLDQATHLILFTQGTTGVLGKLSVFVLPISTPGLNIEHLPAHGLVGNSYGGVSFENLFVPANRMIGENGDGLNIFRDHFLYWRLMQAAAAIGTGEQALEQMADRIKSREAFGGPIGRFTHLQQPIGQSFIELRMAHALAREAAELIDRGDYRTAQPLIDGIKAEGVEMSLRAVDAAVRAFGGEGYSTSVDLGDRLKDLNGLRIADGTTDVMRMEVVRHAFGREFWEMAVQRREPASPRVPAIAEPEVRP